MQKMKICAFDFCSSRSSSGGGGAGGHEDNAGEGQAEEGEANVDALCGTRRRRR